MDIDKINAAVKARDERLARAHEAHGRKVAELNAQFNEEQRALAGKFVEAEQASTDAANAEIQAAVDEFDRALKAMSDEEMAGTGNGRKSDPTPPTPDAVAKVTAVEVAKARPAAELKARAKAMGLATTGGEVAVAQRLLDAGWQP